MRPEVGIVGAKLLYNDHTVQHAGVLVGAGGLADHVFKGIHEDDPGYMGRAISSQDVSAVTAACLLVKRSVYEEVGGLEDEFQVAFNDVDFQIAEDLGRYEGTSVGTNFQDLQLVDEYILNFPLTLNMGIGDYLNVYSLETKELVSCSKLNFPFEGVSNDEPEGLCETAEGTYIAVVDEDRTDGRRMFCFYETQVPCKEDAVSAEEKIDTNENDVSELNRQTETDTLEERTDSEKNTDLEENTDSEEIPTSSEDYKKEASKSLKKQSAKNTPKEVSFAEKMSNWFFWDDYIRLKSYQKNCLL